MKRWIFQIITSSFLFTSWPVWAASDLIVADIELIPTFPAISTGVLRATISNIGPDATDLPPLSQIGVKFSLDAVECDNETILANLDPGQSKTVETAFCSPDVIGVYDITVMVDSEFDVSESNESNNSRTEPFEWFTETILEDSTVIFDTDLALPAMPVGDGAGTPVCIDAASGLLLAGCDGAVGPQGEPGVDGNLALAGQNCPEFQFVTGFDAEGNIICQGEITNPENTESACTDDGDNDGDAFVDCDDFDCNSATACGGGGFGPENTELACTDAGDNDGNGFADCNDFGCNSATACGGGGFGPENTELACSDNGDNDGDAYTDCNDFSCNPATACGGGGFGPENTELACTDDGDNDGNGWADCDDISCNSATACGGAGFGPENTELACIDGGDNDGNGWIDCDDFNCDSATACGGAGF